MVPSKPDCKSTMLILYTGAPCGLTPVRSDFVSYVKADIPVKYFTKVNGVVGIGITIHTFVDVNGTTCYLLCVSYHIASTCVLLFSPQTYHQIYVGYYTFYSHHIMMHLNDHNIKIPINSKHANLTVITFFCG